MTAKQTVALKKLNDDIKKKRQVDLTLFNDNELVAELKKRGWRCHKTEQNFDFGDLWSIDYDLEPVRLDFDLP